MPRDAPADAFPELQALLDVLGRSRSKADITWVARYLSRLVGRRPPWTYNYLVGTLHPTNPMRAGKPLRRAVLAALAILDDGAAPAAVLLTPVQVLAPAGIDARNAQLPDVVRDCATPGCPNRFVPNAPRRRYCYLCRPIRRKGS